MKSPTNQLLKHNLVWKVIHEKMLVMHQISTLQLAKQTKNTNFYFFRILEKIVDCHFKTIQTMTPKNHNIV